MPASADSRTKKQVLTYSEVNHRLHIKVVCIRVDSRYRDDDASEIKQDANERPERPVRLLLDSSR